LPFCELDPSNDQIKGNIAKAEHMKAHTIRVIGNRR
jgi:hypothetical protein